MNLQYYHNIWKGSKGGATFCVDVPEVITFMRRVRNNILDGRKIRLSLGIAYCSPNDFYNKKLGRQLSKERLVEVEFELENISKTNEDTNIILTSELGIFNFKIRAGNDKVWLLSVY